MSRRNTPSLNGTALGIAINAAGEKACVIELLGELDLGTISQLEGRLMRTIAANEGIVLDLRRLSFIDSSGIALLIQAHRAAEARGRLHTVAAPGSQVDRVFTIAGIDRVLRIFSDRDEAVAALAPQPARKSPRVRAA